MKVIAKGFSDGIMTDTLPDDAFVLCKGPNEEIARLRADLEEARGFVRLIRNRARMEADDLAETWWVGTEYNSWRDLETAADALLSRTEPE